MSIDVIKYLSEADTRLAEVIKVVGQYSIKVRNDPFQSLIESIIYQQLAGRAASIIYSRFLRYYGNSHPRPEQIISTSDSILRAQIGLSNRKIEYIKDLSTQIIQEALDLSKLTKLADEEIVNQLMQVKGIGRWTSEMFLIFCLGRLDVLPVSDLGVKKAMKNIYSLSELPKPSEMLTISQPWKPYRTIATWYLWKTLKSTSIG